MVRSLLMSVAILFTSVSFADAAVRTWTDITGRHAIEAEAVAVKQGWVQLKRADGKLISVKITKLSKADQQYIAELPLDAGGRVQQNDEPADSGTAISGLEMSAEARWSKTRRTGSDGNELPRHLQVAIVLSGKPAAEATAVGHARVDSAIDDNGNELTFVEAGFGNRYGTFSRIDRKSAFNDHPTKGVLLPLDFEHPAAPITEIASIKGSLKLDTGATFTVVDLDIASLEEGKPILNDAFKKAGITLAVENVTTETLNVVLTGERDPITNVVVVGSAGEMVSFMLSGGSDSGNTRTTEYTFLDGLPAGAKLLITVRSGGAVLDVPFEFNKLKVPPAP